MTNNHHKSRRISRDTKIAYIDQHLGVNREILSMTSSGMIRDMMTDVNRSVKNIIQSGADHVHLKIKIEITMSPVMDKNAHL